MGCIQTRNVSDEKDSFFNSKAGDQTINLVAVEEERILPKVTNTSSLRFKKFQKIK